MGWPHSGVEFGTAVNTEQASAWMHLPDHVLRVVRATHCEALTENSEMVILTLPLPKVKLEAKQNNEAQSFTNA